MYKKKLIQLTCPQEIKKIIKNAPSAPKIKIIKKYLDNKSYSLVAIYDFKEFKLTGVANSNKTKEYPWKVTKAIYPFFEKNKKFSIPKDFAYNKDFGIFFREYKKGKLFNNFEKKENIILVKELLNFLTTIKKKKEIKKQISLSDFEKNIKILNKTNILKTPYLKLKSEIKNYYKEKGTKFFVHGDFQPHNLISGSNSITLIDLEKAHFGLKEEDPANLMAHLKYSLDFNLKEKDIKKWEKIIYKGYNQKILKTFEQYFKLLIVSHVMIWNNYKLGLKIIKKI